jgi:hypothetical protein
LRDVHRVDDIHHSGPEKMQVDSSESRSGGVRLAKRLQKLEKLRGLAGEQKVLRLVVTYVGASEDAKPTCSRTRWADGTIMEHVNFGSGPELEGEALDRWVASFPIEESKGIGRQ